MPIHRAAGKVRETRRIMRVGSVAAAVLLLAFALVHPATERLSAPLAAGIGLIASCAAAAEIRARRVLAQAGKPVLDFGDRTFLYWRKEDGPPEEISYAEVLTYYSTLLDTADGDAEAFVTIEFRKRRRIRLRSSQLDIGPRQFLALVKLKLDTASPRQNT